MKNNVRESNWSYILAFILGNLQSRGAGKHGDGNSRWERDLGVGGEQYQKPDRRGDVKTTVKYA